MAASDVYKRQGVGGEVDKFHFSLFYDFYLVFYTCHAPSEMGASALFFNSSAKVGAYSETIFHWLNFVDFDS